MEHIPNRIIPPRMPINPNRRPEIPMAESYRAGIPVPDPYAPRMPLLGENPMMSFYRNHYPIPINGPILVPPQRQRRFDKGPAGEDLLGNDSRHYMQAPESYLAFEKVGGDMEISRSPSPDDRGRATRWNRERPNDRDRDYRDRRDGDKHKERSSKRSRSRSKEKESRGVVNKYPNGPDGVAREGIVWMNDNYYTFLHYWIGRLNEESERSSDRDFQGQKRLTEVLTKANRMEREKLILPPEFRQIDRDRMLHCDTTITGLPSAIFFGSGYGAKSHFAKYSAAKELVDKCHRIGVLTDGLHSAIGDRTKLDKVKYNYDISQAIKALLLLRKKILQENMSDEVMLHRHLEPDIIDRFKYILRMVMSEVYYQQNTPARPSSQTEIKYGSTSTDTSSHVRKIDEPEYSREYTERLLAIKEKELEAKMAAELAKQRKQIEEELRAKIVEEERAKIRAEVEREKRIELLLQQQQQYNFQKQQEEQEKMRLMEEQRQKEMTIQMGRQVEDELNRLISELEGKLREFKQRGLHQVLEMIFASATFQTMSTMVNPVTGNAALTLQQKQQLVIDVRSLLTGASMSAGDAVLHMNNMLHQQHQPIGIQHARRDGSEGSSRSGASSNKEQIPRLKIGDMSLRGLSSSEQRRLKQGTKVIAQDMKTGKWQLMTVQRVKDGRATLVIGSATWKKNCDEIYIEDDGSSID